MSPFSPLLVIMGHV